MSPSLVLLAATWAATIGVDPQGAQAPLVPVPAVTTTPPAPSTTPWDSSPTWGSGHTTSPMPHVYSEPEPEEEGGFFSRLRSHLGNLFHRSSSSTPSGCGCGSNSGALHPVPVPTPGPGQPTTSLSKTSSSVMQTGYSAQSAKATAPGSSTSAGQGGKVTPHLDEQVRSQYVGSIGHEEDYSWITGQLYHVPDNGGTWVVRYATTDTIDRFGGKVALAAPVKMKNCREGDLVNVRGQVLSQKAVVQGANCPLYQVQTIDTMARGTP